MANKMKTRKRGRPRNKEYDPQSILQKQLDVVTEVYDTCQEIKATANELGLAELKVRKLLITAGVIEYEQTEEIEELKRRGKSLEEIKISTGLSRASINGYLPYKKGVYKNGDVSSNAEWCDVYRKRKAAVEEPLCVRIVVSEDKKFLW